MNKILIIILAVVAAAVGALVYQTQISNQQPEHALLYSTPRTLTNFELTDHNNQAFGNEQLIGKWTIFFFGYTSCPDICPVTLQEINYIYPELKTLTNDNIQIAFVSADPNRDTVEKLNGYIRYFNEEFVALRGGHDKLFPFARNLGLMYAITDDTTQDYYMVNHSASLVMTNPKGQIQAIFKPIQQDPAQIPSIDSEKLLADFKIIHAKLN